MIPERLAARPVWRGFPIPYVTHVNSLGVPDFKVHDEKRKLKVALELLCQLCGSPLGDDINFLAFQQMVWRGRTGEPPLHDECARFALETCPFLAGGREYATHHRTEAHYTPPPPARERNRIGLVAVSGFGITSDEFDKVIFLLPPPTSVEWFDL